MPVIEVDFERKDLLGTSDHYPSFDSVCYVPPRYEGENYTVLGEIDGIVSPIYLCQCQTEELAIELVKKFASVLTPHLYVEGGDDE